MAGRLRYVIGKVLDFEEINALLESIEYPIINISTTRRSLDGTQTFIHQEDLDDVQLGVILHDFASGGAWNLMSLDNPQFEAMINSESWTLLEVGEGLVGIGN